MGAVALPCAVDGGCDSKCKNFSPDAEGSKQCDCKHAKMHHAPAAAAGLAGWVRDLTREGVEANPGPGQCNGGPPAAPCVCSLDPDQAVKFAGASGLCSTPGCNHHVGLHVAVAAAATAAAAAAHVQLSKTVFVTCTALAREPFSLTLPAGATLHTAISSKLRNDVVSSGGLHQRGRSLDDLSSMHVFRQGVRVTDFDDIVTGDALEFRWSEVITAKSGSAWSVEHLRQLKIDFPPVDTAAELLEPAFGSLPTPSDRVAHVLSIFDGVGADFLRDEYPKQIKELREIYGRAAAGAAVGATIVGSGAAAADASSAAPLSASVVSPSSTLAASSELHAARRRRLLHPLYKSLYMMSKFPTNEALVDDFVTALLRELMLEQPDSDWQHICPQLSMPLIFGGRGIKSTRCDAIADRLIVDVNSFYRMAVFEDKSIQEKATNSEPQLIAEAIAAHQVNMRLKMEEQPAAKKQRLSIGSNLPSSSSSSSSSGGSSSSSGSMAIASAPGASEAVEALDPLLAVRVSGDEFFFYSVSVTPQLLLAMETLTEAGSDTPVRKLCRWEEGQPHGLSFYSAADRRLIVEVLDAMCQCIARAGGASRRRESGASELRHKPRTQPSGQ